MTARDSSPAIRDFGLVFLGGALGTFVRFVLSAWLGGAIWATCAINITGAFVLGLAVALLAVRHPRAQLLWGTGALGGFTTYSLFATDVAELVLGGDPLIALMLACGTVIIGGIGSLVGSVLGTAIRGYRDERRVAGGAE